jgi:hypothetical protein
VAAWHDLEANQSARSHLRVRCPNEVVIWAPPYVVPLDGYVRRLVLSSMAAIHLNQSARIVPENWSVIS